MSMQANGWNDTDGEVDTGPMKMHVMHDTAGRVFIQFSKSVTTLALDVSAATAFANLVADQARAAQAKDKSIVVPVTRRH